MKRCPHCGKSLAMPYPGGMLGPDVAYTPTIAEQVAFALHKRANPPMSNAERHVRQQVQPAPRDDERLLCRTPTHFIYTDGNGGKRTELIEDARRNPARIRAV